MPTYEFRCKSCGDVTSISASVQDRPSQIECGACNGGTATRIVSKPNVVLSSKSKLSRLDPKYDKMVDQAMSKTASADPDHLLRQMRDPATGSPDRD